MQTVLEQGSIDKPLTFDVGLIQLSFIPVCSLNTCNISVKLCRGFALQCFSFFWYHLSRLSSRLISIPSPFAFSNAELILALWLLCSNLNFLISEPPHLFHIACSCNFSASSALSSHHVMSFLYLPGRY